jgi:glycosyltransferase involved in cell wall biosynthesis
MFTCLLHAPVRRGIILEYAASLSSSIHCEGVKVVLQVGQSPDWPQGTPIPNNIVDDQINPIDGLQFGSLQWATNRFAIAFRNSYRRWSLAKKIKADIVHIQLILPWIDWGFIHLHRRSSKVVCTVHDVVPHIYKLPPKLDWTLRQRCYQSADGVVFHTAANMSRFKSIYSFSPHYSTVIPLGLKWYGSVTEADVVQAKQSIGVPEDRLVILMFGELRPNKGLDVLIRAFRQVLLSVPKAFLLIAGSVHPTVSEDELLMQLRSLPTDSWSWRKEWVKDEDMGNYFQAASIVTLPYTAFTSQSGVLTKAYAYSCPLIVSDVGSLGITVQEDGSGLVVQPANVTELTSALIRLLTESKLRDDCQKNIVQVAQAKYSWQSVAHRTIDFYKEILR